MGGKAYGESYKKHIGREFGYYTVLDLSHYILNKKGQKGKYFVKVQCRCGTINVVPMAVLQEGTAKSCGCMIQDRSKLYRPQRELNRTYKQYVNSAKARGYTWKLTREASETLFKAPCFYCGGVSKRSYGGFEFYLNGIDRIDNSKGYVDGNCIPCCRPCNCLKGTGTSDEFWERVQGILECLPTIRTLSYKMRSIDTSTL